MWWSDSSLLPVNDRPPGIPGRYEVPLVHRTDGTFPALISRAEIWHSIRLWPFRELLHSHENKPVTVDSDGNAPRMSNYTRPTGAPTWYCCRGAAEHHVGPSSVKRNCLTCGLVNAVSRRSRRSFWCVLFLSGRLGWVCCQRVCVVAALVVILVQAHCPQRRNPCCGDGRPVLFSGLRHRLDDGNCGLNDSRHSP